MSDETDSGTEGRLGLASIGAPSWRKLFDTHWKFVSRIVRRFGGRGIEVEDAVQDVFLVLFQRIHEFEGQAELTTWMYQICANVGSEHRRRAARQSRLREVFERLPFLSVAARTPSKDLETRDDWKRVEQILDTMSAKHRETFILCELEELSGEEAATILNIPLATVRTRMHYARQHFLRQLRVLEGER